MFRAKLSQKMRALRSSVTVTGRRGRIPQQLLGDLKKNGGYWKLEEEALSLWWTGFGRVYRPVVRQTTISSINKRQTGLLSKKLNILITMVI